MQDCAEVRWLRLGPGRRQFRDGAEGGAWRCAACRGEDHEAHRQMDGAELYPRDRHDEVRKLALHPVVSLLHYLSHVHGRMIAEACWLFCNKGEWW